MFRSSNNQIKRYFLSLQDTDLYCYETEAKDKLKFMHSMIGSFVIDTLLFDPELIEGKLHRKLEIKISEFFKRIFYLPCDQVEGSVAVSGEFGGPPTPQQQHMPANFHSASFFKDKIG